MNSWWWVPIGLAAWFLVSLAVGLCLGPVLRRSAETREALERQWATSDIHQQPPRNERQASPGQDAGPLYVEPELHLLRLRWHLMESQVVRCARYARISLDNPGDELGIANQLADQQRVADARGLVIVRTEVDNDISAINGKHRPGYEAVMAAAVRGEIDVVLVFQTSRFWRNRRERAEGIEILRKAGVSLIAPKGPSLDMSTAYGRGMAGLRFRRSRRVDVHTNPRSVQVNAVRVELAAVND